jgi:hypothetical protein
MSPDELHDEMNDGVVFWGFERNGVLSGVMGLQYVQNVTLDSSRVCSFWQPEARSRWASPVAPPRDVARAGFDRDLGGRSVGDSLL